VIYCCGCSDFVFLFVESVKDIQQRSRYGKGAPQSSAARDPGMLERGTNGATGANGATRGQPGPASNPRRQRLSRGGWKFGRLLPRFEGVLTSETQRLNIPIVSNPMAGRPGYLFDLDTRPTPTDDRLGCPRYPDDLHT